MMPCNCKKVRKPLKKKPQENKEQEKKSNE